MSEHPEIPDDLDLEALSFDQLRDVYGKVGNLAEKSFRREGDCFRNMNGTMVVGIQFSRGKYIISTLFGDAFHNYVTFSDNSVLRSGSLDKEEMILAVEEMIKNLGNRLME